MSDKDIFNNTSAPSNDAKKEPPIPDKLKQLLEVPYQLVPIPSKGQLYEEEHPLYMQESTEIKEMTSVEENILISPALIRQGKVATELLKSCLTNKSIDPDSLLIGDKNALVLAVRISGFGSEYKVEIICDECSNKFKHTFDLSKVELKPLGQKAKLVENKTNLFEFVLPISKIKVCFSLLTSSQDEEISKIQEERKKKLEKMGQEVQVDNTLTDRLLYQIHSMEGETDKTKIATAIRNLKVRDARALREHINEIEPDVNMEQKASCKNCGTTDIYEIPMTLEFFWPKLG